MRFVFVLYFVFGEDYQRVKAIEVLDASELIPGLQKREVALENLTVSPA